MTEEQERELRGLAAELAEVEASPWQPRTVRNAFLPVPVLVGHIMLQPLTMIRWLRLDRVQSPFLGGAWPLDTTVQVRALVSAVAILSGDQGVDEERFIQIVTPEETLEGFRTVATLISDAFSPDIEMRREGPDVPAHRPGGFGRWLVLMTCLITDLGLSVSEAMQIPVAQALCLHACHSWRNGFVPAHETYLQRDAGCTPITQS